jgi:hypothetical protein
MRTSEHVPILENERHELFAQQLAQGKSASEAYVLAGFKPSRKNASRLRAKEDINARVRELQEVAAQSCEISLQSVCKELDEAIAVARAKGQAAPLVNAASLRARLGGLLVERHEVAGPGDFSECRTEAEIVAALLTTLAGDVPIEFSDEDRANASELVLGMRDKLVELVASCAAKPVNAVAADIKHNRRAAERQKLLGGNSRQR